MKSATICRHSLPVIALLCLVVAVLGVGLIPKPASAYVTSYEWLGATYMGSEDPLFDGTYIVAYKAGDTAKLVAKVTNSAFGDITVDFARLKLGWSVTPEEADAGPKTIAAGAYGIFEWVFQVPTVDTASNLVTHDYRITIQYDVEGDADRKWTADGSNFAVYSEDQTACCDSANKWDANNDAYTLWGYEGRRLMTEALYLYNKAEDQYAKGEFDEASASYADAVVKQQEAIDKDANSALTGESAQTLEGTGGTKGTGYLIAGIGILLAGIGILAGGLLWGVKGKKSSP